jgi:hypothetical protein
MSLTNFRNSESFINSLQAFATYLVDTASLYQSLGGSWSQEDVTIYK